MVEHQPEGVVGNEKCKILWDMTVQCDHTVEARRPDIVVFEKEKKQGNHSRHVFTLGPQSV